MSKDIPHSQISKNSPLLIILSGLSGVGKDTVLRKMKEQNHPHRYYAITATTRSPRVGEKDKVHYHFLSEATFCHMVKQNDFLECAKVYNNWYGVPKQQVEEALANGKDTIIKVDVQGAATIKKIMPQAILIFLSTPSQEELSQRLERRSSESSASMQLRIKQSQEELKSLPIFNYVVMNNKDKVDIAIAEINDIITNEKLKAESLESGKEF